jgi:Tfp pilus assembly protein PilO
MLLLGNLGQQLDIEDQRREMQELRSRLRAEAGRATQDFEVRLDKLERQSDEMKLYLAALVRYLAAKGQIDLREFEKLVDEIDAEDGAADGRYEGKLP